MKQSMNSIAIICACYILSLGTIKAQSSDSIEQVATGYLNFSLAKLPSSFQVKQNKQELTLYGCNTRIRITTNDSVLIQTGDSVWLKEKSLVWDSSNQVITGIPYGYRGKANDRYYVSKYYMASPPIIKQVKSPLNKKKKVTYADIGILTPDQFTFFGDKPVQYVYLDYSILKPVYLNEVGFDYDYVDSAKNPSCDSLKLDLIPLNIQCKDFEWKDRVGSEIIGAKGASGIGRIRNETGQRQFFLPSYQPDSLYLDCDMTILDDIIKGHEVYFANGDSLSKKMSLTEFYKKTPLKKIKLFCRTRNELPSGCREDGQHEYREFAFPK